MSLVVLAHLLVFAMLMTAQTKEPALLAADTLSTFNVPVSTAPAPSPPIEQTPRELEKVEPEEQPPRTPQTTLALPEPVRPASPVPPPAPPLPQPVTPPVPPRAATIPPQIPQSPPQRATSRDVTWESRLMAHIERFKRYPRLVGSRRPMGTAVIRFRMDRAGNVLSASLAQSAGDPALDSAAKDTVQRAAPLPRIPDDRPAELELSVSVEFTRR